MAVTRSHVLVDPGPRLVDLEIAVYLHSGTQWLFVHRSNEQFFLLTHHLREYSIANLVIPNEKSISFHLSVCFTPFLVNASTKFDDLKNLMYIIH